MLDFYKMNPSPPHDVLLKLFINQSLSKVAIDSSTALKHSCSFTCSIKDVNTTKLILVCQTHTSSHFSPVIEAQNSIFSIPRSYISLDSQHPFIRLLVLDATSFTSNGYNILGSVEVNTIKSFSQGSCTYPCNISPLFPHSMSPLPSFCGELTLTVHTPKHDDFSLDMALEHLSLRSTNLKSLDHQFRQTSQRFFSSFKGLLSSWKERYSSITSSNELGQSLLLPLFISPCVINHRLIPTPQHAARLVSLIPLKSLDNDVIGQSKQEVWLTPTSTLSLLYGDVIDHCNLLASMLIYFGLNAFVGIGTYKSKYQAYVLTLNEDNKALIWDTTTGKRFSALRSDLPFENVCLIYNGSSLFFNVQKRVY
ncbi:hypothetical protein GEMRC1_005866 [Eukaryota sp. GEM-RC1]